MEEPVSDAGPPLLNVRGRESGLSIPAQASMWSPPSGVTGKLPLATIRGSVPQRESLELSISNVLISKYLVDLRW